MNDTWHIDHFNNRNMASQVSSMPLNIYLLINTETGVGGGAAHDFAMVLSILQ